MSYEQRFIRYASTRSIFDLSAGLLDGYDDTVIVCIPRLAWNVARSWLYDYGQREVSFAWEYRETGYYNPPVAVWDDIQAEIGEALGVEPMCTKDIVRALERIAHATEISAACCGTSKGAAGAGGTDVPESPYIDDGQNFPQDVGFSSRQDYLDNKCLRANAYVSGLKVDLAWLQGANVISLATQAFLIALVTPIPFDDLAAFIGLVVALATQGVLTGLTQEVIDFVNNNQGDMVCDLYRGNTVGESKSNITIRATSELSSGAKAIFSTFVTNSSLNSLYAINTTLNSITDTVGQVCDLCPVEGVYNYTFNLDFSDFEGEIEQLTDFGNGDTFSGHQFQGTELGKLVCTLSGASVQARLGAVVTMANLEIGIDVNSGNWQSKRMDVRVISTTGYDETFSMSVQDGVWVRNTISIPGTETGELAAIEITNHWDATVLPPHGTAMDNLTFTVDL